MSLVFHKDTKAQAQKNAREFLGGIFLERLIQVIILFDVFK
ncbi:recombinase A [Leeuwenhoekiella blandensis MED217]|uniref:Recombinase A n=1 Tax=Leeuwenhoekiella blandensis (strain CECT 7118 / CCUG 51940 / KCTC 22103 / MED217) TaxID=398720 RepID=A3XGX1_LEEBM|nr:recombinase A [Leeuwenhoekiella blandensis MED217]